MKSSTFNLVSSYYLSFNKNRFKFFTNAGGLKKPDIKDILERDAEIYKNFAVEAVMNSKKITSTSVKRVDYMTVYTSDLVKAVRKAAGDTGSFPNHISNPVYKPAMKAITQVVLNNKADLGIIFDTDVDRLVVVDSTGREFNRNRLIALMSAIVLEEHIGTPIVIDSVTSDGLTMFIEKKLGGKHHRFKRGYKNIIDEAILGEESHLAIETSGHGALKGNHWLDDGAKNLTLWFCFLYYTRQPVKILNKLASARAAGLYGGSKVLIDLVDGPEEPVVVEEMRLKINRKRPNLKEGICGSFRDYGEAMLNQLENRTDSDPKFQKAPINFEGVSVSGFGGWFLLRLSFHFPVLPLNIEAPSYEDAVKLGLIVDAAVKENLWTHLH
ncbi:hypothetical protein Ddye_028957 [Dipteronia dyeriana]|uniref:phosphoglucomutase (alpha-D-glucose-1,6-bisphosphate-dependent) n=1 Tax=Dipteronia dyeriana TaxID=168575 RepID=A0AAD9TEA4_9ROSI|nr:hypothetical protein Ddye_028957 [Dipteronia dyeriana]